MTQTERIREQRTDRTEIHSLIRRPDFHSTASPLAAVTVTIVVAAEVDLLDTTTTMPLLPQPTTMLEQFLPRKEDSKVKATEEHVITTETHLHPAKTTTTATTTIALVEVVPTTNLLTLSDRERRPTTKSLMRERETSNTRAKRSKKKPSHNTHSSLLKITSTTAPMSKNQHNNCTHFQLALLATIATHKFTSALTAAKCHPYGW